VAEAATVLVRHLRVFVELGGAMMPALETARTGSAIPETIYNISIDDLDLSPRVFNGLKRAGITKVGQILEKDEDELLSIRNFGQKSLEELREHLAVRGLLGQSQLALSTRSSSDDDELEEDDAFGGDSYGLDDVLTAGAAVGVPDARLDDEV